MKYFEANVNMAVEVEYEVGGRHWSVMKGDKVKAFCDNLDEDEYLSDIDYATKQDDPWVRKVLNTAMYNWVNNQKWWKAKNFTCFDDVVDHIIKNKLVA